MTSSQILHQAPAVSRLPSHTTSQFGAGHEVQSHINVITSKIQQPEAISPAQSKTYEHEVAEEGNFKLQELECQIKELKNVNQILNSELTRERAQIAALEQKAKQSISIQTEQTNLVQQLEKVKLESDFEIEQLVLNNRKLQETLVR